MSVLSCAAFTEISLALQFNLFRRQLYTCWDKVNIAKSESESYYSGNNQ
jgi:hypothetical protein